VLVVDDEPSMSHLVALTLEDAGFEVIAQPEGASALRAVDDVHPDVIVLDLHMPVMDGPTFFRCLRERGDRTPVLLLSGSHSARRAQRELGADDALQKPFDPDELVRRLRLILRTPEVRG
jgi:DNA-binding response OmpR family regulator